MQMVPGLLIYQFERSMAETFLNCALFNYKFSDIGLYKGALGFDRGHVEGGVISGQAGWSVAPIRESGLRQGRSAFPLLTAAPANLVLERGPPVVTVATLKLHD